MYERFSQQWTIKIQKPITLRWKSLDTKQNPRTVTMFRQEVVLATDRVGPLGSAGHKRCLAVERWLVAGRGEYKQQWLTAVLTVGCGGPGTVLASEQCSPRAVSAMYGVDHGHGLAINECWPEVVLGHQQCLASTSACRRQC